jgi:predicted dehydrogenase
LKVLVVGLGSIGRKHVDGVLNLFPKAEIFALRYLLNSDYQYKSVVNIYSILDVPSDIDFAIISNISSKHAESIITLAQLKCPLLIEKPVLTDLYESKKISTLLKELNIITYVACNLRFHPSIQFIRKYIMNNDLIINEVNIYCGSYLPGWRPKVDFRKVYSSDKLLGGGVHLDLIHEIDYCCWIFGYPNTKLSMQSSSSSLKINSIDSARYLFRYNNYSANITLNYYRLDPKREIEIVTSNDTLLVDLISNKVSSLLSGKVLYQSEFNMIDTYTHQIKYFTDKLSLGETPMNNFDEAVKVLTLALNE